MSNHPRQNFKPSNEETLPRRRSSATPLSGCSAGDKLPGSVSFRVVGGPGGGIGGLGPDGGLRIPIVRCSFAMVAIGWWLVVGGLHRELGGWIQAVGATARAILLARFRVLVFHAPAHCWTGIERWERPRRGLTHPRGIERSACRIRRWLQYRRFGRVVLNPVFVIARCFSRCFLPGWVCSPTGRRVLGRPGWLLGGRLPLGAGLPDLLIASVPHLCTVGKGVVSLKIADFSGGLGGRPLLGRKVEYRGGARFRLSPE